MKLNALLSATVIALAGTMASVAPANAAFTVAPGTNVFGGFFEDGVISDLGLLNLSAGTISVNGGVVTADTDNSGVRFDVFANPLLPAAQGSMQILLELGAASPFTIDSATFDGNPIVFDSIVTGLQATFSANFASAADLAPFFFQFSNGTIGDNVQIRISPVPLPAAGLLLLGGIGALGGLGFACRRRSPAAA